MKPEQYLERMSALGITRGQLDQGFNPDRFSVIDQDARRYFVNGDGATACGEAVPPIAENLDRFAAKASHSWETRMTIALCRSRSELRPFYQSLYERHVTLKELSEEAGVTFSAARSVVCGYTLNPEVRVKLQPFFTRRELAILNWKSR